MFRIFIFFPYFFFAIALNAQSIDLMWAKAWGEGTYLVDMKVDQDNSVYMVGLFDGTVDFDPGIGVHSATSSDNYASDSYILKLSADGDLLWVKTFGGVESDGVRGVDVDNLGNVYVIGTFEDSIYFDPGGINQLEVSIGTDCYVMKLDPDGNFIWLQVTHSSFVYPVWGSEIVVADNALYTTGYFKGIQDLNPGLDSSIFDAGSANYDAFIQKFDLNGNFIWAKAYGHMGEPEPRDFIVDSQENLITSGVFDGVLDVDPSIDTFALTEVSPTPGDGIYIQKLDSSGALIWAIAFGGEDETSAGAVKVDSDDNIIHTGWFDGTADFDPGPGIFNLSSYYPTRDIFLLKLDENGAFIWAKTMGSSLTEFGADIEIDNQKNIHLIGGFSAIIDFDPGPGITNIEAEGINSNYDIFIEKFTPNGEMIWVETFGSGSHDTGRLIELDSSENIVIAGSFKADIDMDPTSNVYTLTEVGSGNEYLAKYTNYSPPVCATIDTTHIISSCTPYTWINGNSYSSSNNTAVHIIQDVAGCDSIIYHLDLTINNIATGVSLLSPGMYADYIGGQYQWLDCDNNYQIVSGETSQLFYPTALGNYAVEITSDACVDTSNCYFMDVFLNSGSNVDHLFKIYPTITEGQINVERSISEKVTVEVWDMQGKRVLLIDQINDTHFQFFLNESPGLYVVRLISENFVHQEKIILK